MHDIWGLCPDCRRWFECRGWFDRAAPQPVCDRCGLEPVAIENRAVRSPTADVDARGTVA